MATLIRRTLLKAVMAVVVTHHKPGHGGKPSPTPTAATGYGSKPYGATAYGVD